MNRRVKNTKASKISQLVLSITDFYYRPDIMIETQTSLCSYNSSCRQQFYILSYSHINLAELV
jgi:hypothetical protein